MEQILFGLIVILAIAALLGAFKPGRASARKHDRDLKEQPNPQKRTSVEVKDGKGRTR